MAVVYFTSNASTGAGSLVEAIKNASPGDVIRPDETVFERGSTIEIVLAASLAPSKNLTLDGGPFRVRLNGDGLERCCNVTSNAIVELVAFDFIGGGWDSRTGTPINETIGGGALASANTTVIFTRCSFFGCYARSGGGVGGAASASVTLNDCIVTGCRCGNAGGGIRSTGNVVVNNSTIVGNLSDTMPKSNDFRIEASTGKGTVVNCIVGQILGNINVSAGSVANVALSQIGFAVSPPDDLSAETWSPDAWRNWNLRLLDDASPNPSSYRDAGDVAAASKYDFDGNFRGRKSNGVATCSPGAYETIQADLFWIGRNYEGTEVVYPFWQTTNGWATSRFATRSGAAEPTANSAVFIGSTATFTGSPPIAAEITIGANGVSFSGSADVKLTLGATWSATVGGTLAGLRLGDWSALSPSSLTIPAVEFIGANASIASVPVSALDGVIFAAAAQPSSLTTTGSGGWANTTVGVTALTVTPVSDRTVAVVITKTAELKAAFAQVSDDDGAIWRVIPTTSTDTEYEVAVKPGSDATVRVATAAGWLAETVSTSQFLPVWTVQNVFETVVSVANAFEVVNGGSNDGLNDYDFEDYGYL